MSQMCSRQKQVAQKRLQKQHKIDKKKGYPGFARYQYTDITTALSSLKNKDHQMLEIEEMKLNQKKSDESKDLAFWYNLSEFSSQTTLETLRQMEK